ncbi:MAG: hypothetical protein IJ202_14320 [Bacteroidales bacterium]|nr:hypothetical protein [Bacteroidales bacterium]
MSYSGNDTFFQWRRPLRMDPILLEVLEAVECREGYRGIYKVRWHILRTDRERVAEFLMATDKNGSFYEFHPIPREVYLQATEILSKGLSYGFARRKVLSLIKPYMNLSP